jgi:hypothetical protein
LPLFRFGLRDLLVYTAFLCLVLVGMLLTKGIAAAVVLMAALVVAAHVIGTALGSRLRESSGRFRFDEPSVAEFDEESWRIADHMTFHAARRSCWHGRGRAGRRRISTMILAGAVFGGLAGGGLIWFTVGDRTSLAGVLVGSISLAVLGGWFAFLAANFYMIFRHGLREAAESDREYPRQS